MAPSSEPPVTADPLSEETRRALDLIQVALARARHLIHGSDKPIPAEAALATLPRTLEQATRERDEALEKLDQRAFTETADAWVVHRFNQEYDRAEAAEAKLAELAQPVTDWEGKPWTGECRYQHKTECWGHGRALRMAARLAEQAAENERLRGALADCRVAMLQEGVDILWSNGTFWIDELSRTLASPSSEREAA